VIPPLVILAIFVLDGHVMQLPLSLLVIAGNEYIATSTGSIKFHEIIQTFTEGSSPASFNGVLPMKVVLVHCIQEAILLLYPYKL
jgi:hypothetical protein